MLRNKCLLVLVNSQMQQYIFETKTISMSEKVYMTF